MNEDLRKRYGYRTWSKRRPAAVPVLLKEFKPWRKDCLDWRQEEDLVINEVRPWQHQRSIRWQLRRSIWSPLGDPNQRILIEVREATSSLVARQCLLDVLAQNALSRLPEGPEDIGDVCFIHPTGQTPGIFWASGNLCMSVLSIGCEPVPAQEWARRLHRRVTRRPKTRNLALTLTSTQDRLPIKKTMTLRFDDPPALSEEGFYKFFPSGANLHLKGGGLRIYVPQSGAVTVDAFVEEPSRPPRAGRLEVFANLTPR